MRGIMDRSRRGKPNSANLLFTVTLANRFQSDLKSSLVLAILMIALLLPETKVALARSQSSANTFQNTDEVNSANRIPLGRHHSGSLAATVGYRGLLGSGFIGGGAPSFRYPAESRTEYLFGGGLWVGGVVGDDTLVSTAAVAWFSGNEFFSKVENSGVRLVPGIADQNYRTVYTDTAGLEPVGPDWYDDREHIPLNIEITQTSRSWADEPYNDFIIIEYSIYNFGLEPIHNAWVGFYLDCDVYVNDLLNSEVGHIDDIAGYLPESGIAYIADNDGHTNLNDQTWNASSQPAVLGAKIIDFSPAPPNPEPNFNWWQNGVGSKNWGPRQAPTPENPWRDFGGDLGNPRGDKNRYYLLSHPERDYDQIFTALDHSSSGWLAPPEGEAINFSLGADPRFLLSQGGLDLPAGDTLKVTLALVIGEGFHVEPQDFYNFFDPYWPELVYDKFDFSDLVENMQAAEELYRADYLTPVYFPPPAPTVHDSGGNSSTITWVGSSNPLIEGYDIYLAKLSSSVVFCDIIPIDTLVLSSEHLVNSKPVPGGAYELTDLVDGAWYAVSVAIRPPDGRAPRLSVPTVFKFGEPDAPVLLPMYQDQEPDSNGAISVNSEVNFGWTSASPDVASFNIYRYDTDGEETEHVRKLRVTENTCLAIDLVCDSLAENGLRYCGYHLTPYQTVPGDQLHYREQVNHPTKFRYRVTAVDSADNESPASDGITIYTLPEQRRPLAILLVSPSGETSRMRWDSLLTYYDSTLSDYQPEFFYKVEDGVLKPRPSFEQLGAFDNLLIDGSALAVPLSGNDLVELEQWIIEYAFTGGTVIYLGSGVALGHSPSTPALFTRRFDSTRIASWLFGIDSTTLISRGVNDPRNSEDSLYRYFRPIGALSSHEDFPALAYNQFTNWYSRDFLNEEPIPFKGIMYPRKENTEILYTYLSGREPLSVLNGLPVGVKYTAETHTAYTIFASPFEWELETARRFFAVILGDTPTEAPGESDNNQALLPDRYTLEQNQPNPFNPTTSIHFSLPERSLVQLSVYNLLGQRVETLLEGDLPAGRHQTSWNGSAYASGIYFARLKTDKITISRKMLLLK